MQTITVGKKYNREFAKSFIPLFMKAYFDDIVDHSKLRNIDKYFNIDSYKVLETAINSLDITENINNYTISIDKNIKMYDTSIEKLLRLITYGNRNVKGYSILDQLFTYINTNIDGLYKKYRMEIL